MKTVTKEYWEKGDLMKCNGFIVKATDLSEGIEVEEDQIPTREEINTYRLNKAMEMFPKGTTFKSAASDCEFLSRGNFQIMGFSVVSTDDGLIYDSVTDKWATPLIEEETKTIYPMSQCADKIKIWAERLNEALENEKLKR